jgi:hypothetical protein
MHKKVNKCEDKRAAIEKYVCEALLMSKGKAILVTGPVGREMLRLPRYKKRRKYSKFK